ncbi:MAG TPA: ROK family protein [Steroidobacteraceae bacterium]|jgi:polyphosphate glucokinase|nr:ROK family protein [Steroidobacteraceae bacterium]
MNVLGIDVGGSSIKGGVVDTTTGRLVVEMAHVPTPHPSTPPEVMKAVVRLAAGLPPAKAAGFAFPSVVKRNIARTAANVDHAWIGTDGAALASGALGIPTVFLNDADAAGLAEMKWGAGRDTPGTVIMLTFGTGIGTALFIDGKLVPNMEFGHLELHGADAETWASARVRTEEHLDFPAWIARVNEYLHYVHALFWPDVFILGGAVVENYDRFAPLLKAPCEIRPAHFGGQAGVIGAALAAAEVLGNS